MQTKSSLKSAFAGLALFALSFVMALAPASAGTTSWRTSMGGELRMMSSGGPLGEDGSFSAGLQLRLKTSWKTYWRFPGDSGIPITADFSRSINLESATLDFPAPERHFDGYSTSIGYKGDVVLPLTVRPADPDKPVFVNVKVRYGVCDAICVPLEDDLSLIISTTSPADEASASLIAGARARVPVAATVDDPLAVIAAAVDNKKPRNFTFTARLSDPKAAADLFVEGPEGSYLTVPTPLAIEGDIATWTLPADGLIFEGDTVALRLTLINGAAAIDQTWSFAASDLD
jgi:DsbC/DsbD-like thiol-disulfide interchange protein